MSKFDDKLQAVIERKAKHLEDQFWTEFSHFINKWGLSDSVKFNGVYFYQPKDATREVWREKIFEKMVEIETQKFLNEIGRLHSYFGQD